MKKPQFILNKQIVTKKYNQIKNHVDMVSYSSKTNQQITPILEKETDCMFSVHLENELKHIKDMSRVIFLAQAWDKDYIIKLINLGITHFVIDNEADLDILLEFLKTSNAKIHLSLRLRLKELTIRTERYYVFGMSADVINKRIQKINNSKIKQQILALGIHFHRKTQNMSDWKLKYQLEQILEPETLNAIDTINIGGGLPSSYANTNDNVLPSILKHIDELKMWLHQNRIKLIAEPGRFIAAEAVTLETEIIGIYNDTIIVNASVYNSDMDALIVPVKLLIKEETDDGDNYMVKGVTPCSLDLFRYRVKLKSPKIGDTITFINAGAYNFTTDFCDLEKIKTIIK